MVKRYGLTFLLITLFIGVIFAVYYAMQEEDQDFSYHTYEYTISPRFREFYEQLGGEETLGVGISKRFDMYDKEYQYVVAGLMRFDPSLPDGQQFSLSAIGLEMGIEQTEYLAVEGDNANQFRNGYPIYNKFLELYYSKLQGPKFAGEPLSGPIPLDETNATIQYFENIGFYLDESDPESSVRLLPYGVWMCKDKCLQEGTVDPMAIVSATLTMDTLFDQKAQEFTAISGEKISSVRYVSDGKVEQVYENIVLHANRGNLEEIQLRPLGRELGYATGEPGPPTTIDGNRFMFTTDDYGYHINDNVYQFIEAIEQSKEWTIFGAPIQEPEMIGQDTWQQCFENICLEYFGNGADIHALPLGQEYLTHAVQEDGDHSINLPLVIKMLSTIDRTDPPPGGNPYPEPVEAAASPTPAPPVESKIDIQAAARQDLITSAEEQVIDILLTMDGTPLEAINTEVTIHHPGGLVEKYYPSITDRDGKTSLTLDPISAPNGTRIEFSACLLGAKDDSDCVTKDFLIWGNSP